METRTKSHTDLIVWQKAVELSVEIYQLTDKFPSREIYGITNQMRRAAVSIPSNIAEGRNRGTRKDYAHFLHIAYGSAAELETQMLISKKIGYAKDTGHPEALLQEVSKMLHVMINKLQ
ncbi:MAG TPA: four helix bundle protein [Candidatus Paceibacterota bacterium]